MVKCGIRICGRLHSKLNIPLSQSTTPETKERTFSKAVVNADLIFSRILVAVARIASNPEDMLDCRALITLVIAVRIAFHAVEAAVATASKTVAVVVCTAVQPAETAAPTADMTASIAAFTASHAAEVAELTASHADAVAEDIDSHAVLTAEPIASRMEEMNS
jgi:hypothetical protein